MKKTLLTLFVLICFISPLHAEDMRKAALMAKKELEMTLERDQQSQTDIQKSKLSITQEIDRLEARNTQLKQNIKTIDQEIALLHTENETMEQEAARDKAQMDELSGAVRVAAGNLSAILTASMYTADDTGRRDKLAPVLDTDRFPGIDDMKTISNLFLEESALAGGIELKPMNFVSDTGEKVRGDVLILGGFTAAYRLGDKTGFLNYSPEGNQLYALSALPSRHVRKTLDRYMSGESDSVFIDISRGGALRQITHKQSLKDQIQKGGLLVWPILALGMFAVFIGIERTFFLGRVHANTDKVMGKVNQLAAKGLWEDCNAMVGEKKIPVYNVLRSGLGARSENRETLESILQESILKELPRLERFLPMLNIMGSIAPLIGLLGTVTGMISTFHVITLYGTGDPRMMSGGISTALVTTMMGLGVAIPIMLLYTFLCRRVEHVIGDMEEKAVALTNIIYREIK
ncbi:MotA/TolQ/ExbB proton channel family protein [Desulfobacula phenolica]|uniref:Biopolymer transport protein ExbB n=1 Tax=Desulfobacula phenolica TaxID=90732 RepID=A0A1H2HBH3_9BACT|nr:MotA/TolQ/ExbB proton channel family protein [Desulfobacula phenolica]SDU29142.1 biopolymer transport protein ExbB [Desulfobacula phenolica]